MKKNISNKKKLLAVIPARGGSKGLPGKNIRPLAGFPLIAHTILAARMCDFIDRIVVSTDDQKISDVAMEYGADVPFIRPGELAKDETPMWPVLRHALQAIEESEGVEYEFLLLLDPTSPGRIPDDLRGAVNRLIETPEADGIVGVSRPEFNPIWHCVTENGGWMSHLIDGGGKYACRQEVPIVYRINASLYIWRTSYVRRCQENWHESKRMLIHEIPELRAIHIDDIDEFERAELLIENGKIKFPWMP